MVPSALHAVGQFPRNGSGKADRRAVAALLEARMKASDHVSELVPGAERLMSVILEAPPALDSRLVRTAPTLFDAAMDSLAIVALIRASIRAPTGPCSSLKGFPLPCEAGLRRWSRWAA